MSQQATAHDQIRFYAHLVKESGLSYTARLMEQSLDAKKFGNLLNVAEELESVILPNSDLASLPGDIRKAALSLMMPVLMEEMA